MTLLDLLPSQIIESSFYVDTDLPFRFQGREYLLPVYDNDDRTIVLYFGRQSEKSTTLANKILLNSMIRKRFRTLYVSAADMQTTEFSQDKIDPKLKYSPIIYRQFWGPESSKEIKNNVYLKELKNGSRIVLRSVYKDPDRSRGISADLLACDEVQDINPDFLPVIEECISHSKWKYRLYAGTPDVNLDALDEVWKRSDQTQFMFRCPADHWNVQDADIVTRMDLSGIHCKTCGKVIDRSRGEWVITNPGARTKGYRTSQLMVPWLSMDELVEKLEDYPTKRFYNEVLALPYDSSANPVTENHLKTCCDDDFTMIKTGVRLDLKGVPVFAGIDYGTGTKSFTVICFIAHLGGKWTLLRAKRYTGVETDASRQMELLLEELDHFRPVAVSTDWGFGFMQNSQIKLKYKNGEVRTMFSSTGASPITYNKSGDLFSINRSYMMSRVFNMIVEERIRFPKWSDFAPFANDILAIRAQDPDDNPGQKQIKYTRVAPDDFFHALMYASIAGEIHTGKLMIEAI